MRDFFGEGSGASFLTDVTTAVTTRFRVTFPLLLDEGKKWTLTRVDLHLDDTRACVQTFSIEGVTQAVTHDFYTVGTPRYRHIRAKIFSYTSVKGAWLKYLWWVHDHGFDPLGVLQVPTIEHRDYVFRVRRVGNLAYLVVEGPEPDLDLLHGLGCMEDGEGFKIPGRWTLFGREEEDVAVVTRRLPVKLTQEQIAKAARERAKQEIIFLQKSRRHRSGTTFGHPRIDAVSSRDMSETRKRSG